MRILIKSALLLGLMVTSAQAQITPGGGGGGSSSSITTWAGGTLGAMANYGTSPGAVLVPGMNAFVTNIPGVNVVASGNTAAVKAASTAPAATDPALVVSMSPNSINANGQAAMASSAPVTIASDQAGTCTLHTFFHITSATDTLAVQGVSNQTVRLCAWKSRAAGVATWYFENTASTNANCSSSKTQISGVATEAANTGEAVTLPLGITLNNTSGNGLCINSTGTGGVDIDIWYAQR